MVTAIAFIGTVVVVAVAQSARWRVDRWRRLDQRSWLTYMQDPGLWVGWPLVMVIGTYVLLMLAGVALTA
jgi:hypothetical protein